MELPRLLVKPLDAHGDVRHFTATMLLECVALAREPVATTLTSLSKCCACLQKQARGGQLFERRHNFAGRLYSPRAESISRSKGAIPSSLSTPLSFPHSSLALNTHPGSTCDRATMTATVPSALPCASSLNSYVLCLEDDAEDLEELTCQASDPKVSPADFSNWISTQSSDAMRRLQATFCADEWGTIMDRINEAGAIEKMTILLQCGFSADLALQALAKLDSEVVDADAVESSAEHGLYATTLKAILQFQPADKVTKAVLKRMIRKGECQASVQLLQEHIGSRAHCGICTKPFLGEMIQCSHTANHPSESSSWFYVCCAGLQHVPSGMLNDDAFEYTCWSCSQGRGATYPYGEVPTALHDASFESCVVFKGDGGSVTSAEGTDSESSDDASDTASDSSLSEKHAAESDDESFKPSDSGSDSDSEDESNAASEDEVHSANGSDDESQATESSKATVKSREAASSALGHDQVEATVPTTAPPMADEVKENTFDAGSPMDMAETVSEPSGPLVFAASSASRRTLRLTYEQKDVMEAFLKARCRTDDPARRSRGGPLWKAFQAWRSTIKAMQHTVALTQLYFYAELKERFEKASEHYRGIALK